MEIDMTKDTKPRVVHAELARGRGNKVQDVTRRRIEEMLKLGSPNDEIKRACGVSDRIVKEVAREAGIFRGPRGKILTRAEFEAMNAKRQATNAEREPMRMTGTQLHIDGEWNDPLSAAEARIKVPVLRAIAESTREGLLLDEREIAKLVRARDLAPNAHELRHILFALRGYSHVDFRFSPNAEDGILVKRLEVTRKGRDYLAKLDSPGQARKDRDDAPYAGANHEQFIANSLRAAGGAPVFDRPSVFESPPPPVPAPTPPPPPAPPMERVVATRAVTPRDYPEITKLLDRQTRITQAAEALEAAGLEDMALEALAKVDDLAPLEREVLRLMKEAGWALKE